MLELILWALAFMSVVTGTLVYFAVDAWVLMAPDDRSIQKRRDCIGGVAFFILVAIIVLNA